MEKQHHDSFSLASTEFITSELARRNWHWVLTLVFGLCLALVLQYRYLKDPLRSIPGPFLARLSGAWVVLLDLSGKRSSKIQELHQKYGTVVRVAPNQLCFASPQALKDIYGANSKFLKAPIYDALGFKSTFTTRDRDEYRVMKKRIVQSFSPAAVAELEPLVHKHTTSLLKCLDKRLDAPLDILPWFRMLALSVVGEGFAGESFSGLETEKTPELLHSIDEVFPALWVWWMFPITASILQYSPFKGIRRFLYAGQKFKTYCEEVYQNYLTSSSSNSQHHLISRMVNERLALEEKNQSVPRHVTDTGIVEEITNLIFAGTDTTSNTLAYLFWELAHQPEWQLRLREELKEAIGDQVNPRYDAISELPVLEAIVQETLRVRPAAPSGLQRLTPIGGAVIDGLVVPPNIIVSCQAMSSQRDPDIFPEPDRFFPQRWIDGEKAGKSELMREQFTVFGKGARACLGRRLATMELKYATAAVVRRYNVEIGSPTTDADMEMMDHSVLTPKGGKCVLRLSKA